MNQLTDSAGFIFVTHYKVACLYSRFDKAAERNAEQANKLSEGMCGRETP
jgi:hypothetical protein